MLDRDPKRKAVAREGEEGGGGGKRIDFGMACSLPVNETFETGRSVLMPLEVWFERSNGEEEMEKESKDLGPETECECIKDDSIEREND